MKISNKKINELDLMNEYIPLLVSLGFDKDDLVKQANNRIISHKDYYDNLWAYRGVRKTPELKLDFQSIHPYKETYTIGWYMPMSEGATEHYLVISCKTVIINILTGNKELTSTLIQEIKGITENSTVSEFVKAIRKIESNIEKQNKQ